MGDKWTASFITPAEIAPPVDIRFALAHDSTLVHVSASVYQDLTTSNQINIGTPTDTDAYLEVTGIPSHSTPSDWGFTSFATYAASRTFPRLSAGDVLVIQLTRSGGGNLDDQICVTLTFLDD